MFCFHDSDLSEHQPHLLHLAFSIIIISINLRLLYNSMPYAHECWKGRSLEGGGPGPAGQLRLALSETGLEYYDFIISDSESRRQVAPTASWSVPGNHLLPISTATIGANVTVTIMVTVPLVTVRFQCPSQLPSHARPGPGRGLACRALSGWSRFGHQQKILLMPASAALKVSKVIDLHRKVCL